MTPIHSVPLLPLAFPRFCCTSQSIAYLSLQAVGTLGWQDAFFYSQAEFPAHEPARVLDILKRLPRVMFNEVNEVFSWDVSHFWGLENVHADRAPPFRSNLCLVAPA